MGPIPSLAVRPLFGHVAILRNIAVITPPAGERKETLEQSISSVRYESGKNNTFMDKSPVLSHDTDLVRFNYIR